MESNSLEGLAINEIFNNKSILITGATGPIGKLIAYKILTSIESIRNVYLLIRNKNGITVPQRFEYLIKRSHKLFEKLDEKTINKLVPIEGDITVKGLGLSEENRNIIVNSVSVVFHAAVDMIYDSFLWKQLLTNVGGTKEVIDLCRSLKRLDAFVHISSVYTNPDKLVIEEKIYLSHVDPIELLEIAKQSQSNFTPEEYLGTFPNSYTFTRNLAEKLVEKEFLSEIIPMTIVRLGFVGSSYREPFAGWFESINSITTRNLLLASGLVRASRADPDVTADIVPVDCVANTCIVAARNTMTKYQAELQIYNCNSSALGAPKIGQIQDEMFELMNKYPILKTVRPITKVVQKTHWIPIFLIQFFSETCFSYILDFFLLLLRKKRFIVRMMEINQQILNSDECFVSRQWHFTNKNFKSIAKDLNVNDKKTFDCDLRHINWFEYLKISYFTGRKLLLRESDEDIHKAQDFVKFLKILYTVVNRVILYYFIKLMFHFTPVELWIQSLLNLIGISSMSYNLTEISLFVICAIGIVKSVLYYTSN